MQLIDMILNILLLIGLVQAVWLLVMLYRRRPQTKLAANPLPPLTAIWIVLWPLYQTDRAVLVGTGLLIVFSILVTYLNRPFFNHLRHILDLQGTERNSLAAFAIGLFTASVIFQSVPEFGFATALAICLALPASQWLDKTGVGKKLGLPADPGQRVASHLLLMVATALVTAFALKVYHGISWGEGAIAALLAGLAASLGRALATRPWQPLSVVAMMATMLWVL